MAKVEPPPGTGRDCDCMTSCQLINAMLTECRAAGWSLTSVTPDGFPVLAKDLIVQNATSTGATRVRFYGRLEPNEAKKLGCRAMREIAG